METFYSRQDGPLCLFNIIKESIKPEHLDMTVHLTLDGDEEELYWTFGEDNLDEITKAAEELERLLHQYVVSLAIVHLQEYKPGNNPILYRVVLMRNDTVFLTGEESELAERTDFKTGEYLEIYGNHFCLDSDFFKFPINEEFIPIEVSNEVSYIESVEEINIDEKLLISCHKYGVKSVDDLEKLEDKFQELLYGKEKGVTLSQKVSDFKNILHSDDFKNPLNDNIVNNIDTYVSLFSAIQIIDLKNVYFSFPLLSDLTIKIIYSDGIEAQLLVNADERYFIYFEETDAEDIFEEYSFKNNDLNKLTKHILNRVYKSKSLD